MVLVLTEMAAKCFKMVDWKCPFGHKGDVLPGDDRTQPRGNTAEQNPLLLVLKEFSTLGSPTKARGLVSKLEVSLK